jgi:hypothetical protein
VTRLHLEVKEVRGRIELIEGTHKELHED